LNAFGKPDCFQYSIGGVSGLDLVIDGKAFAVDRAFPHLVVALSLSYKVTTVLLKNPFNLGREIAHQATLARGSE
jgi:hypothetical protein